MCALRNPLLDVGGGISEINGNAGSDSGCFPAAAPVLLNELPDDRVQRRRFPCCNPFEQGPEQWLKSHACAAASDSDVSVL
jgi:hypothetical protein